MAGLTSSPPPSTLHHQAQTPPKRGWEKERPPKSHFLVGATSLEAWSPLQPGLGVCDLLLAQEPEESVQKVGSGIAYPPRAHPMILTNDHPNDDAELWDFENWVQGPSPPMPSLFHTMVTLSVLHGGCSMAWMASSSPGPAECTVPVPGRLCLQGHRLLAINISAIPGLIRVSPPRGEIRAVPVPTRGKGRVTAH